MYDDGKKLLDFEFDPDGFRKFEEEKKLHLENLEKRVKELEKEKKELEEEYGKAIDNLNLFRAQIKELKEENNRKDRLISELRGEKGNLRNAGRKKTLKLWKEDIFELWKQGLKDKEIYGHLAKTDENENFHVLTKATYYRFKARYYNEFLSQLDK